MIKDIVELEIYQLKQGYILEKDTYQCIFCDKLYISGDIYTFDNHLVDAHKAIRLHVEEEHSSSFNAIITNDKKYTGLSKVQSDLMTYFYHDIPDKEIAEKTNTSTSTVRYQRYHLREKAKQAKAFLALFELMEEKSKNVNTPIIHEGATMVDERYMTTAEETEKITQTYFSSQNPLVLKSFPAREKKKIVVLRRISQQFDKDRHYNEKEVNAILKAIFNDFVTIRRYLIEYGFMDRTKNCNEYWLC